MSDITDEDLHTLELYRAQYLQLQDPTALSIPKRSLLRRAEVQAWLYDRLFGEAAASRRPHKRYQIKVLKTLVAEVEASFVDTEEDEISDDLASTLAELLSARIPPEAVDVQQKSYVTYTFPASIRIPLESRTVSILEARAIISGLGTTGLRTWEAALHLGKYLCLDRSDLIQGKNVLELGAGTGLLSILASKYLGAKHVAATDGDEGIVDALKTNVYLNGLEGRKKVEALVLRWHSMLEDTQFATDEDFDVVVGADITYDKSIIHILVHMMVSLLNRNPATIFLIAGTVRNEETFAHFLKACERRRLDAVDVEMPEGMERQDMSGPFYPLKPPIRIMRITERQSAQ